MEAIKTKIDQKLINILLLNSSFIDNPSLLNGKMGISIFFFHLARETGNRIYEDYAEELIDEIYEEITIETPLDFADGLAGIGWGIEYLAQNNFIEANTDEVLEEFDNRLLNELIYNTPKEIGLLHGLAGLGAYFLKRIQNHASNDHKIQTLTNKKNLIHLIDELERRLSDNHIIELLTGNKQPFETQTPVTKANTKTTGTVETFDISWDYPALIWFLSDLHEENIFNFKVGKIIECLIMPLKIETNLPQLCSNQLLLTLALTKLLQTLKAQETTGTVQTIETVIHRLKEGINRESIKIELSHKNTVRHGTFGVAWIYMQLYKLTSNNHYKAEQGYWLDQDILAKAYVIGDEISEESEKDREMAYGLLDGLAGLVFIKYLPF